MRLALLRTVCAIGARAIAPVTQHAANRIAHAHCVAKEAPALLTTRSFGVVGHACTPALGHARCIHLDVALCKRRHKHHHRHHRHRRHHRHSHKRSKRHCIENPRICWQDLGCEPPHNPYCCPCEEPKPGLQQDPYRRQ